MFTRHRLNALFVLHYKVRFVLLKSEKTLFNIKFNYITYVYIVLHIIILTCDYCIKYKDYQNKPKHQNVINQHLIIIQYSYTKGEFNV